MNTRESARREIYGTDNSILGGTLGAISRFGVDSLTSLADLGQLTSISGIARYMSTGELDGSQLNSYIRGQVEGLDGSSFKGLYLNDNAANGLAVTTMLSPLALGRGAAKFAGRATNSPEKMVLVYRMTENGLENNVFKETGHLLSMEARITYRETGDLNLAYKNSESTHQKWINFWDDEATYVEAHSLFGDDLLEVGNKTFISVTDGPSVLSRFGSLKTGTIYGGYVPESLLIRQTLTTSTESEWLLKHGTTLLKPIDVKDLP